MQIAIPDRAEVHALHRAKFRQWSQTRGDGPATPDPVNLEEAAGIDRPVVYAFRGRPYRVAPIPFEDGIRLHEIRLAVLQSPDTAAYRAAMREAVRLAGRLAKPDRGWRRLLRWALPNPFRNASEKEVEEVLDFFWKCRTGLPFPVWLDRAIDLARSTSSTSATSSRSRTAGRRGTGRISDTG